MYHFVIQVKKTFTLSFYKLTLRIRLEQEQTRQGQQNCAKVLAKLYLLDIQNEEYLQKYMLKRSKNGFLSIFFDRNIPSYEKNE